VSYQQKLAGWIDTKVSWTLAQCAYTFHKSEYPGWQDGKYVNGIGITAVGFVKELAIGRNMDVSTINPTIKVFCYGCNFLYFL